MGGDPVPVIQDIRSLLDIGRDRKNPREDYLGEFYCPGHSALLSQLLPPQPRAWTFPIPFSPPDVYVFGVGPLVNQENINALASKKDKERHVFKVKDMENLEDVFFQMLGRKIPERYKDDQETQLSPQGPQDHSSSSPEALAVWKALVIPPLYLRVVILVSWHCPLPDLKITELQMTLEVPCFIAVETDAERSRASKLARVGPEISQVSDLSLKHFSLYRRDSLPFTYGNKHPCLSFPPHGL